MSRFYNYPEAESLQSDDVFLIDGETDGTRKIPADKMADFFGEQVPTDKTLAVSNMAADAKVVGDEISEIKSAFDDSGVYSEYWEDISTITPGNGYYNTNVDVGDTVSTVVNASTSFGCQLVAVQNGDIFKVSGTGGNTPLLWAFTDESYKLISKSPQSGDPHTYEITATANGYLFVNSKTASGATYGLWKWVGKSNFVEYCEKLDKIEDEAYTVYDKNIIDDFTMYNIYATNGEVGSTVDFSPTTSLQYGSLIDTCSKGQKYKITGTGGSSPRLWCFVDSENKIVSVSDANASLTGGVITAPDDGKLIYQCSISYPYAIEKLSIYGLKSDAENIVIDQNLYQYTGFDMFRTIAGLGDSYTEGDLVTSLNQWVTVSGINYLASIAKRNGIVANNYGSGGARTDTYLERPAFANCLSDTPSDLYLLCFGINDANYGLTVGTVADIKPDYTDNPNTFYGNYGRIIDQLSTHAPDAKIILIMPWTTDADYTNYNNAVKGIAEHYAIPYIDPKDDPFFTSHFWLGCKSGGHPTAMLYAGMGRAVERLFNRCVISNAKYFKFAIIG